MAKLGSPATQTAPREMPASRNADERQAENFQRKDFTHSEAVAIKRALEPEIKAAAQERMKNGKPSSNLDKGRACNPVANTTANLH